MKSLQEKINSIQASLALDGQTVTKDVIHAVLRAYRDDLLESILTDGEAKIDGILTVYTVSRKERVCFGDRLSPEHKRLKCRIHTSLRNAVKEL